MTDPVFTFGSNLAGRHGAGAALWAKQNRGAKQFQGVGYQGNSYAIPTKDKSIKTLPLRKIRRYVDDFIAFATIRSDLIFQLTPIGCGLAGLSPKDIAPMFKGAPANVMLPEEFTAMLVPSVPGGIFWDSEADQFYRILGRDRLDADFRRIWHPRRDEFPQAVERDR